MTNPTKPASGGPKKNEPGKAVTGSTAAGKAVTRTPANRAQSKKIVNQRQTPWGLIIATVLIVLLAIGVIGYAVSQNKKKSDNSNPDKIPGITHKVFSGGDHKAGVISYAESPPMGGPHSPIWADCDGTVYPVQIASENAVHGLEHGAVWITYKPGLPAEQLDVLTKLVSGHPYTMLTPYAGLKSNVSLQAWGYQLFVDSATDSRVKRFIDTLRQSRTNTPELGASCSNPGFKSTPSTAGHPAES
ncbi:DUF3105 domain-containing protein [Jatrophihabitans sp.]|jgi:hypothetical protein|uniref:DUF3105 domain-containing protein n=1 Tax=Jatrophihabitans sp. TaxID=1932789 RepID=UPI002EFA781F